MSRSVLASLLATTFVLSLVSGTAREGIVLDLPESVFSRYILDSPPGHDMSRVINLEESFILSRDARFCIIGFTRWLDKSFIHVIATFDTHRKTYADVQTLNTEFRYINTQTTQPKFCFSEDGSLLAVGLDASVALYNFDNDQGKLRLLWKTNLEIKPADARCSLATMVAFLDKDKLLASVPQVAFVELDVQTGKVMRRCGHTPVVPEDCRHSKFPRWALSRKHGYLAAICDNYYLDQVEDPSTMLILTELRSGRQQHLDLGENVLPTLITYHPVDNVLTVTINASDKLRFIKLETRETIIPDVRPAGFRWDDVAFSPDGKWLLLINFPTLRVQPDLQIISFPDYKVRAAYRAVGGALCFYRMCFSGDHKTLGLFGRDAVLYKIDFAKLIDHACRTFKP